MGPNELSRVIRHAAVVTLILTVPLWLMWDFSHALGFVFAGFWSSANLWVLKRLIEAVFQSKGLWLVALLAQLKIPLLYGIGALILWKVPMSIGAAIMGFHIPFILIVVEAIYLQYKRTNSAGPTERPAMD